MAVEHTPPSTYILRDLHDVAIPESVSWIPQTIGWKILGVILLLIAVYLAYRLALRCCLLYTSPSPRDLDLSRMPSSA